MTLKKLRSLGLLVILLTLSVSNINANVTTGPHSQATGTNLIANPGFEGVGRPITNDQPNYNNWTRATFSGAEYGEIFTPEGWVTWWQEGDFKRPECKVIPNEPPFNGTPTRIYAGYYSGMCFTFYGKQNAGYYQVVRNIPANSVVQASYYAHAWSCSESSPPTSCGDPNAFFFRVGIDPNGGTDPFSTGIVWSANYYHYDTYGLVGPLETTVGEGGVATLFIQAYGKWPNKHNDAYFDNASLVLMTPGEPPTATPAPPPPTSDVPPPPQYTPTPLPDGSIVHVVVSGDTLFGIALTYNVETDELRRLNAGTLGPNDMLSIGDKIVIKPGTGQALPATATPVAVAPANPLPTPTPEGGQTDDTNPDNPPAPTGDNGSICVIAFNDANNDMFRQEDEMPLPNADISIVGNSGLVGNYRTDGISEPYCFPEFAAGQQYIVRHTPPTGYKTDAGAWNLILSAGQVYNVELGYVRADDAGENTATPVENPSDPTSPDATREASDDDPTPIAGILGTILRVSGVIVLLLAIAVGVLFYLSRRAAA